MGSDLFEKRVEAAARAYAEVIGEPWDGLTVVSRASLLHRIRFALLAADAVEGVAVVPVAERRSILRSCLRIVRQTAEECGENDGPPAYWGAKSVGLKIVERLRATHPRQS